MVFGHVIHTEPREMYLSRVAAVEGGCGIETQAFRVNRLCGSGLQAVVEANWRAICTRDNVHRRRGHRRMLSLSIPGGRRDSRLMFARAEAVLP